MGFTCTHCLHAAGTSTVLLMQLHVHVYTCRLLAEYNRIGKLIMMEVGVLWCQSHRPPARTEKLPPVFCHLRSDPSWYPTLCPCQCQCRQNLMVSFLKLLRSEPGLQGLEKGSEQDCWLGLEEYLMDQPALSQKRSSGCR